MKKLLLILIAVCSQHLLASGIPDSTISTINSYHQSHQRYIALYKVINGGALNHYKVIVELDCNDGEFAGWRIKQYDENYIACEQETYQLAFEELGIEYDATKKIKSEELKITLAKLRDFKISTKYGVEQIDINDPELTVQKVKDLANELSLLVSQ